MPRTAILAAGYRPGARTGVFAGGWGFAAEAFQPQAIAAPPDRLEILARRVLAGRLEIRSLTHAVIALTTLGDRPAGEYLQDMLWNAFQVPVFEQIRGPRRECVAWECEAHAGLHLRHRHYVQNGSLLLECAGEWLPAGIEAQVDTERCPCGHSAPRLVVPAGQRKALLPDAMLLT
ncbi:MAG: hypothetical protein K2X35_25595 [Bryobacteraceae bacterium]|nr:hypothetical protein [Bryobacteraceae bacterium]